MERTFTYGNARITIRSPRVRDQLNAEILTDFLRTSDLPDLFNMYQMRQYAAFLLSIVHVEGDAPPYIVPISAPVEDLRAGLVAWLDSEDNGSSIYDVWRYAMQQARTPANDADLRPEPGEKKDEAAPS
jgi:hypothetical protein